MIKIIRTNAQNLEFKNLVKLLNADLAERDGKDHPLSQFNAIDSLKYVVLAYEDQQPIGCGALAECEKRTMEIKRMYVSPEFRGKKIGFKILSELENWAKEMGCSSCVLFMGANQPEARKLYKRNNYRKIQKYGKLKEIADGQCFAKEI